MKERKPLRLKNWDYGSDVKYRFINPEVIQICRNQILQPAGFAIRLAIPVS